LRHKTLSDCLVSYTTSLPRVCHTIPLPNLAWPSSVLPQRLAKQPFLQRIGRGEAGERFERSSQILQIRTFILYVTQPKGLQQEILILLRATRPLNKNKGGGIFNKGNRVNKRLRIRRREVGDRVNTGTRTQTLQYHKLTFSPIEL
jgi:hypothetical protein